MKQRHRGGTQHHTCALSARGYLLQTCTRLGPHHFTKMVEGLVKPQTVTEGL